jgi:hypothetical protein
MRKKIKGYCTLLMLMCLTWKGWTQEYDQMPQINYEEIPEAVQNSLFDVIEKMNLDDFRFNFHKYQNSGDYIVVFLRQGIDLSALEGLETIIFRPNGQLKEKRYKYYSEELLVSVPLDLVMIMQEKTKDIELNYLTKIATTAGDVTYHAVSQDSAYVFNEKMEYMSATTSRQYLDDLIAQ